MAGPPTSVFDRHPAFTRGYLLTCDWAGTAPPPDVEQRIPRLAGEMVHDLYARFRELPRASREALRASWPKREPRCRLDEMGVHPTWITAHLQSEPPPTLLLALGELKPDLGREVLRSFWPRVKPGHGEPIEVKPLAPAWSGELRRWLYRRFVHAAFSPLRQEPLDHLASLDAPRIWLFAQDLGREELACLAAASVEEIEALLHRLRSGQAVELKRWLGLSDDGSSSGPVDSGPVDSGPVDSGPIAVRPKAGRPPELDSERFRIAAERVCAVFDLEDGEGNFLGLLGLRSLAAVLSRHPREYAERIAHQIDVPIAKRFLTWRDTQGARGGDFRFEESLRSTQAISAQTTGESA